PKRTRTSLALMGTISSPSATTRTESGATVLGHASAGRAAPSSAESDSVTDGPRTHAVGVSPLCSCARGHYSSQHQPPPARATAAGAEGSTIARVAASNSGGGGSTAVCQHHPPPV